MLTYHLSRLPPAATTTLTYINMNDYQLPVTDVERAAFSLRLRDAARGPLRWLLLVFLRTYESIRALLAEESARRRVVRSSTNATASSATAAATAAEDTDLASLTLGPLANPGERARAARILRTRLASLLEDARDVWLQHRRGSSTSSTNNSGTTARSSSRSRRSTAATATAASSRGGARSASVGTGRQQRQQQRRRSSSSGRAQSRPDVAAAMSALQEDARRRDGALLVSATLTQHLDTGAGPRRLWEAMSGERFAG
jgi:hypothetical protein